MEKAGEDRSGRADQRTTGQAKWTFLVYMAGDNNLDGAALRDIAEMAKAGSTKDVNILVQLDRIEDQTDPALPDHPGRRVQERLHRKLRRYQHRRSADPLQLRQMGGGQLPRRPVRPHPLEPRQRLVGGCQEPGGRSRRQETAPAPFPSQPSPRPHRSICYDDTSGGDALDNRELRVVLAGICALLGRKIDLLGMDACLMNMVEVAYQLRESVNVIVGSEIEEPFDGWPYAEILTRLTARPRQDAAALARWIVKSYLLSYKGKDETVTQSALDVSPDRGDDGQDRRPVGSPSCRPRD